MVSPVLIEFDMRIKNGGQEEALGRAWARVRLLRICGGRSSVERRRGAVAGGEVRGGGEELRRRSGKGPARWRGADLLGPGAARGGPDLGTAGLRGGDNGGGQVALREWRREAEVLRWRPLIGRSNVATAVDASDGGRTYPVVRWR